MKLPVHLCGKGGVLVRAIAQEVSNQFLSAAARVRFQVNPYGFYGGQIVSERGVYPSTAVSIMFPVLQTLLHLNITLTGRTTRRSLGIFKHSLPCGISGDTGLKSTFTAGVPA